MLGDTGNKRAVRILLECILVFLSLQCHYSRGELLKTTIVFLPFYLILSLQTKSLETLHEFCKNNQEYQDVNTLQHNICDITLRGFSWLETTITLLSCEMHHDVLKTASRHNYTVIFDVHNVQFMKGCHICYYIFTGLFYILFETAGAYMGILFLSV